MKSRNLKLIIELKATGSILNGISGVWTKPGPGPMG